ncbi:MAG: XRE family transcriptional regulator [Bacteroidales bacterium]|nr:XRE family transcriptional regulator [Bacteroidales bacterium]
MNSIIHIGKIIRDKLAEEDRSIAWLAQKINHDRSSLCKLLKKDSIDTALLLKISVTLRFDFFSHFSDMLHEKTAQFLPQKQATFATS